MEYLEKRYKETTEKHRKEMEEAEKNCQERVAVLYEELKLQKECQEESSSMQVSYIALNVRK